MPFASINPTNPRNNLWNFCEKDREFFESAILEKEIRKKNILPVHRLSVSSTSHTQRQGLNYNRLVEPTESQKVKWYVLSSFISEIHFCLHLVSKDVNRPLYLLWSILNRSEIISKSYEPFLFSVLQSRLPIFIFDCNIWSIFNQKSDNVKIAIICCPK